jgi:acyl-CoA synthetase (NDP forming)
MERFFRPKKVAVVGASANPLAIGGQPIRQMQLHGFEGDIYPVNPNRDRVQELPCYPSVADLPSGVDVAIIAVPAANVIEVVEQCGRQQIPFAVVLSSGFADAGGEGVRLQEALVECANRNGVRVVGPNCVGYISMAAKLYAGFGAFFDYQFAPGPVSFVTQSGGVGGSLLTILDELGIGFRHFIHTGNAADTDIELMLDAFIDDPGTHVLLAYVEGLAERSGLAAVARRALQAGKPLVAWKAGTSARSGGAVVSHTGRMAGDIDRYRAIFRKYGVIEVDDTADLGDVLVLAQAKCCPSGRRVGIVSVSGGAGVIAADCLEAAEYLTLAQFSTQTEARIAEMLPGFATSTNPVDVTAQIFNQPDLFEKVVAALCENDEVDLIVACVASVHSAVGERIAQAIRQARKSVDIPIIAVWASRRELNQAAFELLEAANVPLFRTPERALRAADKLGVLAEARARVAQLGEKSASGDDGAAAKFNWHRTTEVDVLQQLAAYGIGVPRLRMVGSESEAVEAREAMGGRVAMKIQSPDIAHKAAMGGVRLDIADKRAAAAAYHELMAAAAKVRDAEIRGVVVQEMVAEGPEAICGYVHDRVLGDFLLCGGGGANTEATHDVRLIPMPATKEEMEDAFSSTRIGQSLVRSKHGVNDVVDVLNRLQQIVIDSANGLSELEINPVIVASSGCIAVDALAIPRS